MCGRYTQKKSKEEVEERFGAAYYKEVPKANFNASPGTLLPIITMEAPTKIVFAKWGLVAEWAQQMPSPKKHVNATLERICEAKSFSSCIERKRCLVFADGYYEWKTISKDLKIPYYVTINKGDLFAFAGIYEKNKETKELTFSLITQPPNEKLAFIHHRMPAILTPEQEKKWLDKKVKGEDAQKMIVQYPEDKMDFYTVSMEVNRSSENNPAYIQPVEYKAVPVQGDLFGN